MRTERKCCGSATALVDGGFAAKALTRANCVRATSPAKRERYEQERAFYLSRSAGEVARRNVARVRAVNEPVGLPLTREQNPAIYLDTNPALQQ